MNENKNFNQSKNGAVDRIHQERQMIHNVIDCALADPETIKDIEDGEITAIRAAMEALQVYELLPEASAKERKKL